MKRKNTSSWRRAAAVIAGVLGLLLIVTLCATNGVRRELAEALANPTPVPISRPMPTPQPTPEPTPAETPEPTPEPEPEDFTLSFVGDCVLSDIDGWTNFSSVVGDDYHYPFAATADYFQNDEFTMANLECPLADTGVKDYTRYYAFRGKPDYVNILTQGGVDFVMTSNNHTNDYGEEAKEQTLLVLDGAGLGHAGQDETTVFTTKNGLRIGVYCAYEPKLNLTTTAVANLLEQDCDLVIVSVHWGTEYTYHPADEQVELAHAAVDAGADLVIGTHPHVLQPMEVYSGSYIFYSLGNWVFGGNTEPYDGDTAIAQVHVRRLADGTVAILGYSLIPCAMSGSLPKNDYQPVPYAEGSEDYDRALSKLLGTFDGPDLSVIRG